MASPSILETSRRRPLAPRVRHVGVSSAGYDSSCGSASRGWDDFRFARVLNWATPGGEGSEGRRLHPRPSAFQKPKRRRVREADSAQNRVARGSAAADPNSLLAGNFLAPRSALRSRKPCNVMALLALQPAGCGGSQARNREFPTSGTGRHQALSERNREKTGGRKRGAAPGVARL